MSKHVQVGVVGGMDKQKMQKMEPKKTILLSRNSRSEFGEKWSKK